MQPNEFERSILSAVFFQTSSIETQKVIAGGNRFVHYTSADTAFKIIENKELWLRNASVMNDFSEVSYGVECLKFARSSQGGRNFEEALNAIHTEILKTADNQYAAWLPWFQTDTFLSSFAIHDDDEDDIGRLSMWRAYGDVAIVFKQSTFTVAATAPTGVTVSPVSYLTPVQTEAKLWSMAQSVRENHDLLRNMLPEYVINSLRSAMRFAVLSIKHPGFREEREWRIIHSPNYDLPRIQPSLVSIAGVPQQVCKFKFAGPDGDRQFLNTIDRIIIGPAQHADTIRNAFAQLLANNGVIPTVDQIVVSNIPLRKNMA